MHSVMGKKCEDLFITHQRPQESIQYRSIKQSNKITQLVDVSLSLLTVMPVLAQWTLE